MNKALPIIALILVLLSGGAGYYFYNQLQVQNEALQSKITALNVALDDVARVTKDNTARLDKLEDDDDGDDDDDDHNDDDKK